MATELYLTPFLSDANLVSYYRLEGNSTDAKGAHTGTDASISYSIGNGKFGQGAGFNGTTSNIQTTAIFTGTGNFTLTGWVKSSTFSVHRGCFFMMGPAAGNQACFLSVELTTFFLHFEIWSGASADATSVSLADGSYHMIAAVRSGNAVQLYVDGAANGGTADVTSLNVNTNTTFFGSDVNGSNQFVGALDDMAFFNRALSSTEISNLFSKSYGSLFMPLL